MSVALAFRAAGVPAARARAEAPRAESAMIEFGITTDRRAEFFIAEVLHESVLLAYFEEIADGSDYEGRRDLGNVRPGDGHRYKGRGPIQLTGRANYRLAGHALGLSLEAHPELAARHDVGWRIAGWYWKTRGLNAVADRNDFTRCTLLINGDTTEGAPTYLARRRQILGRVRPIDCRPRDRWAGYTASERRWITEYDHLVAHKIDPARRVVLRRVMAAQRKRIWQAAQGAGGWETANRRARYRSLLARTR